MEQALGDLRDELGELEATRRGEVHACIKGRRPRSDGAHRAQPSQEDNEKEFVSQARRVEAQAEVDGVRASADGVRERARRLWRSLTKPGFAVQSRNWRIESAKAEVPSRSAPSLETVRAKASPARGRHQRADLDLGSESRSRKTTSAITSRVGSRARLTGGQAALAEQGALSVESGHGRSTPGHGRARVKARRQAGLACRR